MSQQVETYKFHGSDPVRVVTGEDGEPWFVAKDVCDILGHSNVSVALDRLDDDERSKFNLGRQGNTNIVNEAGLYSLVLGSRKPEAHEFKRWVTHEVLPSIRKHGGYLSGQEQMTPEQMVLASMRYLESKISEQQATIDDQAGQLEAQKPKVLFADAVGASDGTCLVGELAKMLTQAGYTVGQNRLFRQLRDDGFLGKVGQNRNVPLQRWVEQGLFRIKETAITHPDGHVTLNRTTKVTGKGQRYLIDYYTKGKAAADATVD
ncbi:phage antirepressor KilAC domain-containing protein [Bifidobacterium apri]|uniref:Antirepressor n=1 Tax=Bifidobacterium apri TaxID=1769423 RepID=A0A6A2W063_9BIFI|nr:phage antirepressor [Bifidobacterium apri]KAB8291892.1 antirepressor [Bifidobacterium apri]